MAGGGAGCVVRFRSDPAQLRRRQQQHGTTAQPRVRPAASALRVSLISIVIADGAPPSPTFTPIEHGGTPPARRRRLRPPARNTARRTATKTPKATPTLDAAPDRDFRTTILSMRAGRRADGRTGRIQCDRNIREGEANQNQVRSILRRDRSPCGPPLTTPCFRRLCRAPWAAFIRRDLRDASVSWRAVPE